MKHLLHQRSGGSLCTEPYGRYKTLEYTSNLDEVTCRRCISIVERVRALIGDVQICSLCNEQPTWKSEGYMSTFEHVDYCYKCAFWADVLSEIDTGKYTYLVKEHEGIISVDIIGRPQIDWVSSKSCLGYGGRWFKLTMTDGKVIYTNNMYSKGHVPAHMTSLFESKVNVVKMETPSADEVKSLRDKADA
jgi:hypothetical protein